MDPARQLAVCYCRGRRAHGHPIRSVVSVTLRHQPGCSRGYNVLIDHSQPPMLVLLGINVSSPNIAGRENLVMDALLVISAIGVFYSNSVVSNRQTVEFIDRISVASN